MPGRGSAQSPVGTLGAVALVVGLAGCSSDSPDALGSAPPAASSTVTPTPTPVDWDPEASADWAGEVFPVTGTGRYLVYNSGQLAAARDSGSSVTAADTPTGSYELQLACQGDGDSTITITATSAGAGTVRLTASCDESIQTAPIAVVNPGVTLAVTGTGGHPVLWAAVLAVDPPALSR